MQQNLVLVLQRTIYFLILGASYLIFFLYLKLDFSLAFATSGCVFAGMFLIYFAEKCLPFRKDWIGFDSEFKLDGAYYLFVHTLFGNFIIWLTTDFFTRHIHSLKGDMKPELWLSKYSELSRMIIIILLSDFGRYWLHRFMHTIPLLWRVHAVHHSPVKLYWWNTGRFHPVDKLLVLSFESLLFIFLGVTPMTIALYYVFYSVNGFLQHSNIDIRLGLFNRIISGPEQHRFHHSYIPSEANNNYGNKVSVFDQLFGTYYMPDRVGPKKYGLKNPNYPLKFLKQLMIPFYKKDRSISD